MAIYYQFILFVNKYSISVARTLQRNVLELDSILGKIVHVEYFSLPLVSGQWHLPSVQSLPK